MPSESSARSRPSKTPRAHRPRAVRCAIGGIAIAVGVVLSGCIYASERFEQFLIRDPRFFLAGPADYGLESPNLELHGVQYASRQQILRLFEPDYGRSLYLFPLATRRKTLLARPLGARRVHRAGSGRIASWCRSPSASRSRSSSCPPRAWLRWALIDDDGVILDPPAKAAFQLPVLSGVMGGESQEKRGIRVRRMQRLMKELGPLADNVSEVDASDLDDLKITEQAGGGAVYAACWAIGISLRRLKNFLDHYPDIHRNMPQATSFDLRLDDRITGLEASRDVR